MIAINALADETTHDHKMFRLVSSVLVPWFPLVAGALLTVLSGGLGHAQPYPMPGETKVAEFETSDWRAVMVRLDNDALQGRAFAKTGETIVFCRGDQWVLAFISASPEDFEKFKSHVNRGGFTDMKLKHLVLTTPASDYFAEFLTGRSDWVVAGASFRQAPTLVHWIGFVHPAFQVSLSSDEGADAVRALHGGGQVSISLSRSKGPWMEWRVPELDPVIEFMTDNGCKKP